MKSVVGSLATIVGGHSHNGNGAARAAAPAKKLVASSGTVAGKQGQATPANKTARQASGQHPATPEQVIPFDDDDFSEF